MEQRDKIITNRKYILYFITFVRSVIGFITIKYHYYNKVLLLSKLSNMLFKKNEKKNSHQLPQKF